MLALLALVASAVASPTIIQSKDASNVLAYDPTIPTIVKILWQHDKGTGAQSLQMVDRRHGIHVASCSNSLVHHGLVDVEQLTLDVDANGLGRLILGDRALPIFYEQEGSSRMSESEIPRYISCQQFSDESIAQLDCFLLLKGPVDHQRSMARDDLPDCIDGVTVDLRKRQVIEEPSEGLSEEPSGDETPSLVNPEPCCNENLPCLWDHVIEKVGDGNPKDMRRCEQMTEPFLCTDGTCSTSHTTSYSITFGFQITGSGTGSASWASLGFSVSETQTVTAGFTCNGNVGDVVCMYADQPYLAYDVEEKMILMSGVNCGPTEKMIHKYRMLSPKSVKGAAYCVRGACRDAAGMGYWEDLTKWQNCAHTKPAL